MVVVSILRMTIICDLLGGFNDRRRSFAGALMLLRRKSLIATFIRCVQFYVKSLRERGYPTTTPIIISCITFQRITGESCSFV